MIVIDASVVLKLLMDEEGAPEARKLLQQEKSAVPEFCFIEIANTLAIKTDFSPNEAKRALELVYQLDLDILPLDRQMLEEAMVEAKKYGVAVYDMIYAVLAKKLGAKLITSDGRFARKVGWERIQVI